MEVLIRFKFIVCTKGMEGDDSHISKQGHSSKLEWCNLIIIIIDRQLHLKNETYLDNTTHFSKTINCCHVGIPTMILVQKFLKIDLIMILPKENIKITTMLICTIWNSHILFLILYLEHTFW